MKRELLGFILLLCTSSLMALSPREEQWEKFIAVHSGTTVIPEDPFMGPLVSPNSSNPAWSGALVVCESIFSALEEGRIAQENFHPDRLLPLTKAFDALEPGVRKQTHLYGRPIRENKRITIPVRMDGGPQSVYGHIYLALIDDQWYIEQWSLDLTGLPVEELLENTLPEGESFDQVF